MDSKPVDDMTVDELKADLAALDQPVSGNKADLQERLTAARAAVDAAATDPGAPPEGNPPEVQNGPHLTVPPNASQADAPVAIANAPAGHIRDEANMKNPPPAVTMAQPGAPGPSAADNAIRGLLVERAGYERAGKTDRVAQVDAELKRLGYAKPSGRKAPDQSIA